MLAIVALASSVPGQRCSAQSIQVADETDTIIRFDAVTGESAPEALGVPAQPSIPGKGPYFTSGENFRPRKIRLASAFFLRNGPPVLVVLFWRPAAVASFLCLAPSCRLWPFPEL